MAIWEDDIMHLRWNFAFVKSETLIIEANYS